MRAPFALRPRLGLNRPGEFVTRRVRWLRDCAIAVWRIFRGHSLVVTLGACYALILGALYLPVGSKLMLMVFALATAVFVTAVVARLANGWRLIAIVAVQGVLVLAVVRGLEAFGAPGLSEFELMQLTIPLALVYAWGIDRDERAVDVLEQPAG